MKTIALWAINLYQKHISPRKGYRCAHGVADHTHVGCSGYAKQVIEQHGVVKGLSMMPARFRACKQHAQELRRRTAYVPKSQAGFIDIGDCLMFCCAAGDFSCCAEAAVDATADAVSSSSESTSAENEKKDSPSNTDSGED